MAIGTGVAIGEATQVGGGSVTTFTTPITVTANVSAGSRVVIALGILEAASAWAIADSEGNTYTLDVEDVAHGSADFGLHIFSSHIANALTSGVSTINATWTTGVTTARLCAVMNTGIASASALDKAVTAEGVSSTPSVSTGADTTQADEWLIAFQAASASVYTEDGAWTQLHNNQGGAAAPRVRSATRTVAATATYSHSPTFDASEDWTEIIVTYKGAAAGAGVPVKIASYRRRRSA